VIEGLLLVIELALVIHLAWAIIGSTRPGAKRSLGVFSFKRSKGDAVEPLKTKREKTRGHPRA
jgi:hypothetical protein